MFWPFKMGDEASVEELRAFLHLDERPLQEDTSLEFKSRLDSDAAELARDVCALANGGGGLILYGVEEREGRASGIPGIHDADAAGVRIDQILRERCDLPPRYHFARATAEQAERKVLALQVFPEQDHLVFVREELRSPAKFSCYIRTGPGKGNALSASQVRHEMLRRIDYQRRKEEQTVELVKLHMGRPPAEYITIGVSFTPYVPQMPTAALNIETMRAFGEQFRRNHQPVHRLRTSLWSYPWFIRRALEGIIASSDGRDGRPAASFALTDSGLFSIALHCQTIEISGHDLIRYNVRLPEPRTCIDYSPLRQVLNEVDALVDALRRDNILPLFGQWHLFLGMQPKTHIVRWWKTPDGREWCYISSHPFTSLFPPINPWMIGTGSEPIPHGSFPQVVEHFLFMLAQGFGCNSFPGPS